MLRVTKYCALRFAFTFLPKRGPSTEVGTVFEPWCPQAQSTIQERTRNIAVVPAGVRTRAFGRSAGPG